MKFNLSRAASIANSITNTYANFSIGQPHLNPEITFDSKNVNLQYQFFDNYTSAKTNLSSIILDKISIENIVLCNGAKFALYLTLKVLEPDLVVSIVPNWLGYKTLCQILDLNYYESKFEDIPNLSQKNLKIVFIISNPNNPTGEYYDINYIYNLISRNFSNFTLIVDEVYKDIQLSTDVVRNPENHSNIIRIGSLSKSYAVPGLRIGYIITNDLEFKVCLEILNESLLTSFNSYSLEILTNLKVNDFHVFNKEMNTIYSERIDIAFNAFIKSGFILIKPKFGFYLWVSKKDCDDLYTYFLNNNIMTVKGSSYGSSDKYVRFSLACSSDDFNFLISFLKNY
jgi:aspartate/methionine/tyrosine aminotransferase